MRRRRFVDALRGGASRLTLGEAANTSGAVDLLSPPAATAGGVFKTLRSLAGLRLGIAVAVMMAVALVLLM